MQGVVVGVGVDPGRVGPEEDILSASGRRRVLYLVGGGRYSLVPGGCDNRPPLFFPLDGYKSRSLPWRGVFYEDGVVQHARQKV